MTWPMMAAFAFLATPSCEHNDCLTFGERYEILSEGSFKCGESLESAANGEVAIVDCLIRNMEQCRPSAGIITATPNGGVTIYGLITDDNCEIKIISDVSPGNHFSERACSKLTKVAEDPGFAFGECGAEKIYPMCSP